MRILIDVWLVKLNNFFLFLQISFLLIVFDSLGWAQAIFLPVSFFPRCPYDYLHVSLILQILPNSITIFFPSFAFLSLPHFWFIWMSTSNIVLRFILSHTMLTAVHTYVSTMSWNLINYPIDHQLSFFLFDEKTFFQNRVIESLDERYLLFLVEYEDFKSLETSRLPWNQKLQ